MSTSRKTLIGGVVGVIVAIGLIVAGAYAFGGLGINGSTSSINSMTTQTSSGGGSSATSSGAGSGSSGSGVLQISMLDPPHVPANVVDVYINYTAIQIHVSNAGNQSGWYNVTSSGIINLTSIVTNSKVLASATLPNGTYNIIRFNVTSAVVTVNSSGTLTNYTASVPSGMLQSTITGGVNVQANTTSALLVDISPTVHEANGTYMLIPSMTAHPQTPVGHDPTVTTNITQSNHANVSTKSHPTGPTTNTTTTTTTTTATTTTTTSTSSSSTSTSSTTTTTSTSTTSTSSSV